jgi:FkbM family methyltransferase
MITGLVKLFQQSEFWLLPNSLSPRFIGLSLRSRSSNFRADIRLRRGTTDARVVNQVFLDRDYDLSSLGRADIQQNYARMIGEGQTPLILDVGANIGVSSLYFAKNWPQARILAVEPSPDNYCILLHNVRRHQRIEPLQAAASSTDGSVRIANPAAEPWAYRTQISDGEGADLIPAFSIRSLIDHAARTGTACPFIIKIDIEGFEDNLFSSNLDWIPQFPIIIIELHDWMIPEKAVSNSFLRAISQYRRDFLVKGENVISVGLAGHDDTTNRARREGCRDSCRDGKSRAT